MNIFQKVIRHTFLSFINTFLPKHTLHKNKSFTENGRSMVEMLGVLAVIAVLTLASLFGYRYGIAKYRANETINEVNMHAMLISTAITNGAKMPFDELPALSRMGYPMEGNITHDYPDYFEITLRNVQSDTCKRILESNWSWPAIIVAGIDDFAGDTSVCDIEGDETKMIFVFATDLKEGSQIDPEDKPDLKRCNNDMDCLCGSCTEGICETNCPAGSSCAKNYDDARYFMCCLNDFVIDGFCCTGVMSGKCCNMSGNCCPPETPLQDKDGNCYSCDLNKGVNVTGVEENCYVCPKRVTYNSNGWTACALPCDLKGTSTEGKPIMHYGGTCHECDDTDMPFSLSYTLTKDCSICPNRRTYWTGGNGGTGLVLGDGCAIKCDPKSDKPLLGTDGYCHDCQYTGIVPIQNLEGECSELCPNRHVGGYNNGVGADTFCVPNNCPASTPLQGSNGRCYACNEADGVDVTNSPENCAACDTSNTPRQVYQMGAYEICAMPCNVAGTPTENKPLQINTDVGHVTRKGRCVGCTENINAKVTDKSVCDLCSNRVWLPGYQSANCVLPICSGNTPLLKETDAGGWMLECQPCTYSGRVLNSAQTDTCENLCPGIRVTSGEYCILDKCDGFRDTMSGCHACDEVSTKWTPATSAECNKCPDRIHGFNNQCMYRCGQGLASGKLLTSTDGVCYSCDTTADIKMGNASHAGFADMESQCAVCDNRYYENGYCKLSHCSTKNPLQGINGECYPCDYALPVDVGGNKDRCDVCMNRKLQGTDCVA